MAGVAETLSVTSPAAPMPTATSPAAIAAAATIRP